MKVTHQAFHLEYFAVHDGETHHWKRVYGEWAICYEAEYPEYVCIYSGAGILVDCACCEIVILDTLNHLLPLLDPPTIEYCMPHSSAQNVGGNVMGVFIRSLIFSAMHDVIVLRASVMSCQPS
jgi:hypothetical protein